MTIYKILNNNLILSKDKQGHEIIVKGCGIAFQKKKGQQVDETLIEKIFTAETAQISKEIQGYFASIPEKYLDFVEAYVNEVKEKQGLELNDSIYFSLSDHIMGAISRLNQGIQIQNMLLLDIKQLYHKYFKSYVSDGDKVKKGTLLVEFDLEAIKGEGYNLITPMVVTNISDYIKAVCMEKENTAINAGDKFLTVV